MSISGYLRSELGGCVKFESYMLPDSILDESIPKQTPSKTQNKTKSFVLKSNPSASINANNQSPNSIMEENLEQKAVSTETKTSALDRIYSFAGAFGMKVDEMLSMFGFSDTKNKDVQTNKKTSQKDKIPKKEATNTTVNNAEVKNSPPKNPFLNMEAA